MAIVLNGDTGISSIGTLTGVTSISSAAANTPVIMQDSSSNSATCRAWVAFNGTTSTTQAATYSQSGTTVTVTAVAHGLTTGMTVFLDFTSGTAVDGGYAATVTGVDTFTVTQASRTTSGNVNLFRNTILSSFNVSYVVDGGAGVYSVVLINAMPDANYALAISSVGSALAYPNTKTSSYFSFVTQSASESSLDSTNTSAVIFR